MNINHLFTKITYHKVDISITDEVLMKSIREDIGHNLKEVIEELRSDSPISKERQKRVGKKLKQTKGAFDKLRTWIELAEQLSGLGAWEHDITNDELFWSDETYRILGFDPKEIEPSYEILMDRIHSEDRERVNRAFSESLKNRTPYEAIYRLELPDGELKYVEAQANHFYNDAGEPILTIGTNQNVTRRELEKQEIEESLEEKQTLLGEIHHRLKNNLAVVAGMLQLQWLQEDDPEIVKSLQESTNRIKAVAGIHQQLYQSGNFANVALGENINTLASDLISTMATNTKIELESDCETVYLEMAQTLPCTLIANEVVTNTVKHAFEGRERGCIAIKLDQNNNRIRLCIDDNGVGLPKDFEDRQGSLGMNLISTLSNQLDGEYSFSSSEQGTRFILEFDKE